MLRWFIRLLFGSDHPSKRRIMACEDAVNALEARVEQRYDELKTLRGVVSRMRRADVEAERAEEPAPEPDIAPAARPMPSTEHLARRFRSI